MFLPSTMGFERLQHTQNIHGGDDMGLPSQFTIHLTNIKRIQGNLIMVFTSCWKIKDDLNRLGIKRESVAVEENNVASAFLLLFLSLTSFVPFSIFFPSFSRFSSIQCSFSSVFSSFFSLIFSPCACASSIFFFYRRVLVFKWKERKSLPLLASNLWR
jgi:hypothetical protein